MVCKVSAFVFLVLGAIYLTTLPNTNSRFLIKSTEEESLKYGSNLNRLHKNAMSLYEQTGSDHDYVNLLVSFDRNDQITPITEANKKDTYTLDIPDECFVTSGRNEYIYSDGTMTSQQVTMTCNVYSSSLKNNGMVYVPITIYEQSDGESKFVYRKMDFNGGTLNEYYEAHPIKQPIDYTKSTIQVSGTLKEVYDAFVKWIDTHKGEYANEVDDYIEQVYDLYNEYYFLASTKTGKTLQGLDVNLSENNGIYTLQGKLYENFIGYARTNENSVPYMYFTATTEEELEIALEYYLKTYFFDEETAILVKNYIVEKSNHNINDVLNKVVTINGTVADSTQRSLRVYDWIKDVAYNFANNSESIRVQFYSTTGYMFSAFRYSVEFNTLLSDQAKTSMTSGATASALRQSIVKNYTGATPQSYTDTFTYDNGNGQTVIVTVSSNPVLKEDGTYDNAYTTVEFAIKDDSTPDTPSTGDEEEKKDPETPPTDDNKGETPENKPSTGDEEGTKDPETPPTDEGAGTKDPETPSTNDGEQETDPNEEPSTIENEAFDDESLDGDIGEESNEEIAPEEINARMKNKRMEPVSESDASPLFIEDITDDQVVLENDIGGPPLEDIPYEMTSTEIDHVTTEISNIEESLNDEVLKVETSTTNDQVVLVENIEPSSNNDPFYNEPNVTDDQVTLVLVETETEIEVEVETNHFNELSNDEDIHEFEMMTVTNNVAKMDSSIDMELSNDDDSNIEITPEYTEEYNDATAMEVDAINTQNEVYNNNSISFSDQGTFNVIQETVLK